MDDDVTRVPAAFSRAPTATERREIIVPHEREFHPVTAVRNVVLQSSLSQLRDIGFYERYAKLIDPVVLDQLHAGVVPGWIPIELASAHYAACDNMHLSPEELAKLGQLAGQRLQETSLVSAAKKVRSADFDLWTVVGQLHRMWARLYQGGSAQYVKVGSKEKLLELRGFTLNRYGYFRHAQLTAIRAIYSSLGVSLETLKIVTYDASRDELSIRVGWS